MKLLELIYPQLLLDRLTSQTFPNLVPFDVFLRAITLVLTFLNLEVFDFLLGEFFTNCLDQT